MSNNIAATELRICKSLKASSLVRWDRGLEVGMMCSTLIELLGKTLFLQTLSLTLHMAIFAQYLSRRRNYQNLSGISDAVISQHIEIILPMR
jgi:hypothetical protein